MALNKLNGTLVLLCICIYRVATEIQPVDVESVMKKEQPDFEDLTGPAGSGSSANAEVEGFISKFSLDNNDLSFTHAFISSLCVIIVSELGDKTFFIAAIMAMSHRRLTVFAGAMCALSLMHILSALFGFAITVIPRTFTFYASSALFAIFGLKMLKEGYDMSPDASKEEFEEVQSDLRKSDDNYQKEPLEEGGAGLSRARFGRNRILQIVSRVFLQALTLTFLAEWGDRSQIATVILAAREEVTGVIFGGLLGHFLCTGLAVIGGRLIATRISVKTVTLLGGVVFILFALSALYIGP